MFAIPMMMRRPGATDADAAAWIAAVEAADGQALEGGVAQAIDAFVTGLKADGLWGKIDQCCILAGARTVAGALVPLRGTAPTNNNFISGDYNRKTGLKGNGSNKTLTSAPPSYAQNDAHLTAYFGESFTASGTQCLIGNSNSTGTGGSQLTITATQRLPRITWTGTSNIAGAAFAAGLFGGSRASSTTIDTVYNGTPGTWSVNSTTMVTSPFRVFSRASGGNPADPTTARLAWFSHGRAITLANLAARLDTLMAALAASIP